MHYKHLRPALQLLVNLHVLVILHICATFEAVFLKVFERVSWWSFRVPTPFSLSMSDAYK